jgi:outer membrane protein assembly factor BamA
MRTPALAIYICLWALPALAKTERVDTSTGAEHTSEVRAPDEEPIDPLRLVLGLPGDLTELALAPLAPVVVATERWQLHDRIFDLLTNEDRTLAVVPLIDVFSRSGPGLGVAVVQNKPLGSADRLILSIVGRTNEDRSASVSFNRRLPSLSGRELSVKAGYGTDHDARYYGLGGEAPPESRRLIRSDEIDLEAGIMVFRPDFDWNMRAEIAFRHRKIAPGTGKEPILEPGGELTLPAGFGQGLDYPEATLRLYFDSRDSHGRTTSGIVAALEGTITNDLNSAGTRALRATASFAAFLPLLPLNRVLYLAVGTSMAGGVGGAVPLHQLVRLGGGSSLRGYDSERFVHRLGWWGSAEYRYDIFEYADTGNGFSAVIFGDLGQVGGDPEELVGSTLRWSVGFGLRAETDLFLLGRIQLAYSPEGFQLSLAFGEVL